MLLGTKGGSRARSAPRGVVVPPWRGVCSAEGGAKVGGGHAGGGVIGSCISLLWLLILVWRRAAEKQAGEKGARSGVCAAACDEVFFTSTKKFKSWSSSAQRAWQGRAGLGVGAGLRPETEIERHMR